MYINFKIDGSLDERIKIDDINFHPLLKDIENIFWWYLLSSKALSSPITQNILLHDENFPLILKKYNKWTNYKVNLIKDDQYISTLNTKSQMIFLGKSMSVLMYDVLLASKYNAEINSSSIVQFLKYIRNGTVHNNTFNLIDEDKKWKLEEGESINWQNKKINRELHMKKVFPEFISIFEIFILAKDLSEKLKEIDLNNFKKNKKNPRAL